MEKNLDKDLGDKVKAFYKPRIKAATKLFMATLILYALFIASTAWQIIPESIRTNNLIMNVAAITIMLSIFIAILKHAKYKLERDQIIYQWSGEDTLFGLFNSRIKHMDARPTFRQLLEKDPKIKKTAFAKKFAGELV